MKTKRSALYSVPELADFEALLAAGSVYVDPVEVRTSSASDNAEYYCHRAIAGGKEFIALWGEAGLGHILTVRTLSMTAVGWFHDTPELRALLNRYLA